MFFVLCVVSLDHVKGLSDFLLVCGFVSVGEMVIIENLKLDVFDQEGIPCVVIEIIICTWVVFNAFSFNRYICSIVKPYQ